MIRVVFALLLVTVAYGCGSKQAPEAVVDVGQATEPGAPDVVSPAVGPGDSRLAAGLMNVAGGVPAGGTLTAEQRYDMALAEAYRHLLEKNEERALASFQEALAARPNDFVQGEVARVQALIARKAAVEKTANDIHVVLTSGNAERAAQLAAEALQQFGDSDAAEGIAKLKREADAVVAARLEERARGQRFVNEAESARRSGNLRAALLAYDQAVAARADVAAVQDRYEDIRSRLARYDQARARAGDLRRDPYQIEEAVTALRAAAAAWDTPQVRQEIGECELALSNRRDRLAVADFEVNVDVGIPRAGHVVAEEILPHFKPRFDLVERAQLAELVKELRLQAGDLQFNERSRAELGRVARARYLVLGSISALGGITVNARLVDVQTGLIVQTGRVVAASPEELTARLRLLARVLMMTDEEKIRFEREQAPPVPLAPTVVEILPPVPPPPAPNLPLPAPIVFQAPPPAFGTVAVVDFNAIPAAAAAPGQPVVVFGAPPPVRERAVFLSIELGDNLFRRGHFVEAVRHFEFALALAPQRREIQVRVDNCRPFLPPPPPTPVVVVKPRLAILPFAEVGRPGFVPPGLGVWAAQHIGPYYAPVCDVVDASELFWWMGRLGLTGRDVLVDPSARLVLARALNARHFVVGCLEETSSFDAKAYLVDTEFNTVIGVGRVHVHDPFELKCRLGELARQTSMTPAQRAAALRREESYERLAAEAREHCDHGEFALSISVGQKALALQPDAVEVRLLIQSARSRQRRREAEEAQRRAFERQQAQLAEAQQQQLLLAAAAEQARLQSEQQFAALALAQQQQLQVQQAQAQAILLAQARSALQAEQFAASIQAYESALALRQTDEVVRELARARTLAAERERRAVAEQQLSVEANLRRAREAELGEARAQLAAEQQRRAAAERQQREQELARSQSEYQRLLEAAGEAQARRDLEAQVSALDAARRLKPAGEAERLMAAALVERARADAERQGAAARAQLERELAAERERRAAAEALARDNQAKYEEAMRLARAAMARKQYDEAAAHFRVASLKVRTDEAVAGLKQSQDEQARVQAAARVQTEADARRRQQDEAFQKHLAEGRAAASARQFEQAVQSFRQATGLKPDNVDAQAELAKAQWAFDVTRVEAARAQEARNRDASFRTLLDAARANLKAGKHDAAVGSLNAALQIKPNDAEAVAVLREAQAAQSASMRDAAAQAEAKKKRDLYEQHLQRGRSAMAIKNWDAAAEAFQAAQQVLPGDTASAQFLKEAQKAKADAAAARSAAMQADARQKADRLRGLVEQARASLAAGKFDAAEQNLAEAARLSPDDAGVRQLQKDVTQARMSASATAAEAQKRRAAYTDAMRLGQTALTAKRFADAASAFTEALKQSPNDPTATSLLKQAEAQKTAAMSAAAAETDRRQRYDNSMLRGRTALTGRKYAEAVDAFREALKLQPNDPAATRGLAEAQAAMTPPKVDAIPRPVPAPVNPSPAPPKVEPMPRPAPMPVNPPPVPPKTEPKPKDPPTPKVEPKQKDPPAPKVDPNQAKFTQLIQAGAILEAQAKYAEASQAYRTALQLAPNDAGARKRADFCKAMADGQRDLAAGKIAEAIIDFDQALKQEPNSAEARRALQQAKATPARKK